MFVQRYGGDGPTTLLLHGIPGSGTDWHEVAEYLAPGHRVLVPDLIGFGSSPRTNRIEELWADAQARAVERVLDGPAVVVGHDFGGPVALALYRRRPDLFARLVLLATNGFRDAPIPMPIRAVTWPLVGAAAERVLMSGPGLRMVAGGLADVGDGEQVRATRTIFATALRELPERYGPIEAVLAQVRVPTTVLWGDRDPFFPVAAGRRLAAAIPGARFEVIAGAGHFLPRERPEAVAGVVAG